MPATAADRLYSDLPYVRKHVLAPLVAHLASDLLLYLSLPELRQPALIAHHLLTGALAQLATHPVPHPHPSSSPHAASTHAPAWSEQVPYTHHYILFFAGAAELSNLPLGWIELCKCDLGLEACGQGHAHPPPLLGHSALGSSPLSARRPQAATLPRGPSSRRASSLSACCSGRR